MESNWASYDQNLLWQQQKVSTLSVVNFLSSKVKCQRQSIQPNGNDVNSLKNNFRETWNFVSPG